MESLQSLHAVNSISGINPLKTSSIKSKEMPQFSEILENAVVKLNEVQNSASKTVTDFSVGKKDVHQVMLALQEADLSLKLAVQVRNKVVEAYQEIMRTSI